MPKSYDTDNEDKLYSMALSDLRTASEPAVSYDVTGYFDTAIGDTVEIENEEYVPTLYLSAKLSEQVRSFHESASKQDSLYRLKSYSRKSLKIPTESRGSD